MGGWLHTELICPPEDGYTLPRQPGSNSRPLSRKSDALATSLVGKLAFGKNAFNLVND